MVEPGTLVGQLTMGDFRTDESLATVPYGDPEAMRAEMRSVLTALQAQEAHAALSHAYSLLTGRGWTEDDASSYVMYAVWPDIRDAVQGRADYNFKKILEDAVQRAQDAPSRLHDGGSSGSDDGLAGCAEQVDATAHMTHLPLAHIHAYIHRYTHVCMHALHACIHAYMHTCIHSHSQPALIHV